jgi:hypothetical protein
MPKLLENFRQGLLQRRVSQTFWIVATKPRHRLAI